MFWALLIAISFEGKACSEDRYDAFLWVQDNIVGLKHSSGRILPKNLSTDINMPKNTYQACINSTHSLIAAITPGNKRKLYLFELRSSSSKIELSWDDLSGNAVGYISAMYWDENDQLNVFWNLGRYETSVVTVLDKKGRILLRDCLVAGSSCLRFIRHHSAALKAYEYLDNNGWVPTSIHHRAVPKYTVQEIFGSLHGSYGSLDDVKNHFAVPIMVEVGSDILVKIEEGRWFLKTPNRPYFRPHVSNGLVLLRSEGKVEVFSIYTRKRLTSLPCNLIIDQ